MITLKQTLILCLIALFFSNCDKAPTTPTTTTVAEDKVNIEGLLDDLITQTENLKAGCGIQSLDDFFNVNQGQLVNRYWAENLYNTLETHLNLAYTNPSNRFNYSSHFGTHTWNATNQTWSSTGTPSNKIVLGFPTQMGLTTNGIVGTLHSYVDQSTSFDGNVYWLPTALLASFEVNSQECVKVDIQNVDYDNTTFDIPVDLEMTLTLAPYTFDIHITRTSATAFSFDIQAVNGTDTLSLVFDATIGHSDYRNLRFDDIATVEGTLTSGDFAFQFTGDYATANSLFNPTDNQINNLFDVDILYKGAAIADLDFESNNGNSESDILITYKDNSTEDTETFYQDFIDRLEIVLVEFTGPWVF